MDFKWALRVIGITVTVLVLGSYGWYRFLLLPVGSGVPQTVTIDSGQGVETIAALLEEKGIIRDKTAFNLYVSMNNLRRKLKAGVYVLDPTKDAIQIAKQLAQGDVIKKRVTIPEGSTIKQIRQLFVSQGVDGSAFDTAINATYNHKVLATKPANIDLEGYLFPDSYTLDSAARPDQIVNLMLNTLESKLTPDILAGFSQQGVTLHEGLTIASLIEKEVSKPADRPKVSQVIHKRLREGQLLQIDATVIYAANLDRKDSAAIARAIRTSNSPYNTYKYKGLPPGPIASPGLEAIKAAASPANGDYLFYLSDSNGTTHFARTAEEHQNNINKYLK